MLEAKPQFNGNDATPDYIKTTDMIIFGDRLGTQCPICEKIYNEIGDMNNPSTSIVKREICEDCGKKLKNLINE